MKKLARLMILPASLVLSLATKSPGDLPVTLNFSAVSDYMAPPGFKVEEGLQLRSSASTSWNGFYGYLWANRDMSRKKLTEWDVGLGYAQETKNWILDASVNIYDLVSIGKEENNNNLYELWLNANQTRTLLPLDFKFVQILRDDSPEHSTGRNWEAGISQRRTIHIPGYGSIPVKGRLSAHLNDGYFTADSRLSIIKAETEVPLQCRGITITPRFVYQRARNKEVFPDDANLEVSISRSF